MHPAFLYLPGGRLSLPELAAARLDGDVVDLGEGYVPADLVEDAATRAGALSPLVPRGAAASGPSAAWIHGAGDHPPSPHHIRRASRTRLRRRHDPRVVFHDTPLPEAEVRMLGGILVSTPERTMLDLVLGVHRDPRLREWAQLLAGVSPRLVGAARDAVSGAGRVPGSRSALAELDRLAVRTR